MSPSSSSYAQSADQRAVDAQLTPERCIVRSVKSSTSPGERTGSTASGAAAAGPPLRAAKAPLAAVKKPPSLLWGTKPARCEPGDSWTPPLVAPTWRERGDGGGGSGENAVAVTKWVAQ